MGLFPVGIEVTADVDVGVDVPGKHRRRSQV
jgi:hypothetical protein